MADDSAKRGPAERRRATLRQDYEVRYLTEKYGLSPDQVELLIEQHGNHRAKLDSAARRLAD
jgi:hypothetical protein